MLALLLPAFLHQLAAVFGSPPLGLPFHCQPRIHASKTPATPPRPIIAASRYPLMTPTMIVPRTTVQAPKMPSAVPIAMMAATARAAPHQPQWFTKQFQTLQMSAGAEMASCVDALARLVRTC